MDFTPGGELDRRLTRIEAGQERLESKLDTLKDSLTAHIVAQSEAGKSNVDELAAIRARVNIIWAVLGTILSAGLTAMVGWIKFKQ